MSLSGLIPSDSAFRVHVELTPPRTDLSMEQSVEAWIDSNHFIRRMTQRQRLVFMTDGAIGHREEPNLRHVTVNLGNHADRSRILPMLTTKHTLDYCIEFAARALDLGFRALVVLGGDRSDRVPRCVPHAYELRQIIRREVPGLLLGGWANPNQGASQVQFMIEEGYSSDFYLAQVVSHFDTARLDEFLAAADRHNVVIPGIFGVFYYRSANARTLSMLSKFLPVPVEPLTAALNSGQSPELVCADTLAALGSRGIRDVYVSNLPVASAARKLARIESLFGERTAHVASEHS